MILESFFLSVTRGGGCGSGINFFSKCHYWVEDVCQLLGSAAANPNINTLLAS